MSSASSQSSFSASSSFASSSSNMSSSPNLDDKKIWHRRSKRKPKIVDYHVLSERHLWDLIVSVKQAIKRKWKPLGAMQMKETGKGIHGGTVFVYLQTMIKYDK